jgi:hypothetical protein
VEQPRGAADRAPLGACAVMEATNVDIFFYIVCQILNSMDQKIYDTLFYKSVSIYIVVLGKAIFSHLRSKNMFAISPKKIF